MGANFNPLARHAGGDRMPSSTSDWVPVYIDPTLLSFQHNYLLQSLKTCQWENDKFWGQQRDFVANSLRDTTGAPA